MTDGPRIVVWEGVREAAGYRDTYRLKNGTEEESYDNRIKILKQKR